MADSSSAHRHEPHDAGAAPGQASTTEDVYVVHDAEHARHSSIGSVGAERHPLTSAERKGDVPVGTPGELGEDAGLSSKVC
ncbi:MAG: hypothetical protein HYX52_02240 [Chloroflexi bacterium]|nr:hypothetical protein [Chloroflexota bacterium]